MITRLAHVCIHARDLAATERFYCGVLGLQKAFDFEKAGEQIGFYLRLGETTFIEVFRGEPGCPTGLSHFCLETDDPDAFCQLLLSQSIEVTEKKLGRDNAFQCWFKDPDGYNIEVMQYTAKSLQMTGGVAVIP